MTDELVKAILAREVEDCINRDLEYMLQCFKTADYAKIGEFSIDLDNFLIIDGTKFVNLVNRIKKREGKKQK